MRAKGASAKLTNNAVLASGLIPISSEIITRKDDDDDDDDDDAFTVPAIRFS